VRAAAGDFSHTRSLWFALQAILLIGTVLAVGVWIGDAEGGRVLLAAPLMLVTPHFLTALQVGNFQSTAVCLSLLALILATGRRPGSAGALLGFAVVSKIFPGALVVHLAAGRRWRAVAWCAAFAILFPLAALAIYGWRPYSDFLHQELGRIASGAAFPQTERPSIIPLNLGIYGAAVKLRVLGASWLTPPRGRAIASVYGFLILVLAAWTGWRTRLDAAPPADRTGLAQLWLALLALASFRSPFVGSGYGLLATVWLVTLLAAEATRPAALLFWIAVLAAAAVQFWTGPSPAAGVPPRWALWSALLAQSGALAINGWVVTGALARTRARVARVEIAAAA